MVSNHGTEMGLKLHEGSSFPSERAHVLPTEFQSSNTSARTTPADLHNLRAGLLPGDVTVGRVEFARPPDRGEDLH